MRLREEGGGGVGGGLPSTETNTNTYYENVSSLLLRNHSSVVEGVKEGASGIPTSHYRGARQTFGIGCLRSHLPHTLV